MAEIGAEIDPIQDMKEAEVAFSLSLKAFYPEGAPSGTEELWRCKWFEDPSFSLKNVFVARDRNNNITGGLRVVSRNLKRSDQVFKVFGIAETFVVPTRQGEGLASLLTLHAMQAGKLRGYDIIIVVARKLIDYFYLKHGAYGLGAYNVVSLRGWRDTIKKATEFGVSDIGLQNINEVNMAYEYSYLNSFGPMKRTFMHWRFLLEKISRQGEDLRMLKKAGESVGYFVAKESQVIEIALLPGIPYRPVVDYLHYNVLNDDSLEELVLKIPYTHRLLDEDLQLDVTVKNRECYYGGHMIKILNMKKIMTFLEERVKGDLAKKTNIPINFGHGNVKVKWDGKEAKISYCSDSDPSYEETLFLLGATSVYRKNEGWDKPETLPFVLCEMDEF